MASFGVSLSEIDIPSGKFNSYSLYEADISNSAYQAPPATQASSIEQQLAGLSLEHACEGYTADASSTSSSLPLPSAYANSSTASDAYEASSLASMPYQPDSNSESSSQGSFGAHTSSQATIPVSNAYQDHFTSNFDSYSTSTAYTAPAAQSQSTSYYGDDSPDIGSALPVGPTSQSGYEDGSYPYEDDMAQLRGPTTGSSVSSPTVTRGAIGRASPAGGRSSMSNSRSSNNSSGSARPATPTQTGAAESGTASPALSSSGRNWTRDFYAVQSTISRGGVLDTVEVMDKLTKMTENFTQDAVAYGAIIIKEQHLPVERKSIKPVGVGGIAGGQKFVHEGIFFKFPTNDHDLYGNLENAMKGAGHEMKGLTGLINWELKTIGLHTIKFPLTAIIDYYGYRLVATAVLPLSSKTMVIGSGDAGKTVLDGSEQNREPAKRLASLLKDWGVFLNVAPHDVQQNNFNKKIVRVSICFDLEGHIGTDGNYYLCDFARTFPPADQMGVPGRFLYRLLRPEFVKKFRKPISSDSFLAMQVDKSFNATTIEATRYLMNEWLIEEIKLWNKMKCVPPPKIISIMLHQSGINCRFLRLVAAVVQDPMLKKSVHAEIIARTMKSVIRNEIRESNNLEDRNVFAIITKWFNVIFSDTDDSLEYWSNELQQQILKRFDNPSDAFFDLADQLLSAPSASPSPNPSPAPSPSVSLQNSTSSMGNSQSDDGYSDSPTRPRKRGAKKTTPSRTKVTSSSPKKKTASTRTTRSSQPLDDDILVDRDPHPSSSTSSRRTGAKRSAASKSTASPYRASIPADEENQEVFDPSLLELPTDRYAETGIRRSTRQRKVKDPGPLDEWKAYDEDADGDYDPNQESSSSDEEAGLSDEEPNQALPSRYSTAYGDSLVGYGEDEPTDYAETKPTPAPSTPSKRPDTTMIEIKLTEESGRRSQTGSGSSRSRNQQPTSQPTTPSHLASSSSSNPNLALPNPLSVRIDRNRGILRDQVNLEMLFGRMQELLGCRFEVSGLLKFRCTLNHIERSVKSIISPDGTEMAPNPHLLMTVADVKSYEPRIKQMFLTPFQTAFRYKKEADDTEDFDRREELLRMSSEAYLECLERNSLGDFALHNAARVFTDWLPFFPTASNEAQCVAYLAVRFAKLAEKQNKDLAGFKGDIYKTSDLIEPRTGLVRTKKHVEWCTESLIKNLVLRKMELEEMVADVKQNASPENAEQSDVEIRCVLRDYYDQMFDEFAVQLPKEKVKKVTRKVAVQYWKMLRRVIQPVNEDQLDNLIEKLLLLPTEKAYLTKQHWELAAPLIF